jgi:hypothetical protein
MNIRGNFSQSRNGDIGGNPLAVPSLSQQFRETTSFVAGFFQPAGIRRQLKHLSESRPARRFVERYCLHPGGGVKLEFETQTSQLNKTPI